MEPPDYLPEQPQSPGTFFKTASDAALKASSKPVDYVAELRAAGWLSVHATNFWKSPDGQQYPSDFYSWQMMKHVQEEKRKHPSVRVWIEELQAFYIAEPE
jgi:hypothetical protein